MVPEIVRPHRSQSRLPQLGMGSQPEVIVGGEIDDLLAVETRDGRAFRFEHAQPLIGAFLAPLFELVAEKRERIRHKFSLP